jgi:hypothetical protein
MSQSPDKSPTTDRHPHKEGAATAPWQSTPKNPHYYNSTPAAAHLQQQQQQQQQRWLQQHLHLLLAMVSTVMIPTQLQTRDSDRHKHG